MNVCRDNSGIRGGCFCRGISVDVALVFVFVVFKVFKCSSLEQIEHLERLNELNISCVF